MSLSPCYPEPYQWGTAVVPRSPEGIYKPLYQAMDARGVERIYPATIAQCAGYIQRGDHWDAFLFDSVMTYLNAGFQWAPFVLASSIGAWDTFVNLYLTIHAQPPLGGGHFWDVLWTRFFDPALQRCYWTQSRIQAPNTTRRLDTGEQHLYNAAPWSNTHVYMRSIAISNGSAFGDPWDNPV